LQFSSGERAREALDHQKFVEWLEYHRHEELKSLIVSQAVLQSEVDKLLRSDMSQVPHKMDKLSGIMVAMMGRLDEFKSLAAVAAPKAELSEQAILILCIFAKSDSERLWYSNDWNDNWSLMPDKAETSIGVYEPRFIRDDLLQLGAMGFLEVKANGKNGLICQLTRNGSRFVQTLGDTVKIPEDCLPKYR